jgi:hypothetical protein
MIGHTLTLTMCVCQYYDFEVMGKEGQLLAATTGIVDALQCFSDQHGESYSILPTLPPAVSEKQLIACVNACIHNKKQDKDWGVLFKTHFKLIGKHFSSNNYLRWPLMQIPQSEMSHSKLINTHTNLVGQKLQDAEQEIVGLQQALTAARAETATSLTSRAESAAPPALSNRSPRNATSPVSNDVSATLPPESSDVNSCDFSHNNNSVNSDALSMMVMDSNKVCDPPGSPPRNEAPDPSSSRTQYGPIGTFVVENSVWPHRHLWT